MCDRCLMGAFNPDGSCDHCRYLSMEQIQAHAKVYRDGRIDELTGELLSVKAERDQLRELLQIAGSSRGDKDRRILRQVARR